MSVTRVSHRLIREQYGQALIVAIAIVGVGMILALGAVAFAMNSGSAAQADQYSRAAQQAADAGTAQVMYEDANSASMGYNLDSNVFSLNSLLDCIVPEFSGGISIGSFSVAASNGVCPLSAYLDSSGNVETSQTAVWTALADGNYYESEYLPNATGQSPASSGSSSSSYYVNFPEIVSVGCHSTIEPQSAAEASCAHGSTSNSYSRQLTILRPTTALQSVEATNNVTYNGFSLLGWDIAGDIVGNINAGNDIILPSAGVDVNWSAGVGSIVGNLLNITNTNPWANFLSTFEYGNSVCTGASWNCSGPGWLQFGVNWVHSSQPCPAGEPMSSCTVERRPFTINEPYTPAAQFGAQTSYSSSCSWWLIICVGSWSSVSDVNGELNMNGGTLTLKPGVYYFCNINISSGTVRGPVSGSVQIFVLPPGADGCASSDGNVSIANGITNSQTTLFGTASPSAIQIYVAGNPSDASSLTVGGSAQPTTSVDIGTNWAADLGNELQTYDVYAPLSNVQIGTSPNWLLSVPDLVFEGAAVGWNTTIDATAVFQDMDTGEYPLSSVVSEDSVQQTVECTTAVTSLNGSASHDLAGC